jgi:hypothetical protein
MHNVKQLITHDLSLPAYKIETSLAAFVQVSHLNASSLDFLTYHLFQELLELTHSAYPNQVDIECHARSYQ